MTKKEFRVYMFLPSERERTLRWIERLEKKLSDIPTVKTKVQSSQKEWPYIPTHVTVDAVEPVRADSIRKDLRRAHNRLTAIERRLDKLDNMIATIEDSRTRQILTERYLEGRKLKDVALRFDLTDQHVIRIINGAIKNF